MIRPTHAKLKKQALSKIEVRVEYDLLREEFLLINELIHARKLADKTQEQVAKEMKTTKSAISRLESLGKSNYHLPSLTTIKKYAEAVGCRLEIRLISKKKHA